MRVFEALPADRDLGSHCHVAPQGDRAAILGTLGNARLGQAVV